MLPAYKSQYNMGKQFDGSQKPSNQKDIGGYNYLLLKPVSTS